MLPLLGPSPPQTLSTLLLPSTPGAQRGRRQLALYGAAGSDTCYQGGRFATVARHHVGLRRNLAELYSLSFACTTDIVDAVGPLPTAAPSPPPPACPPPTCLHRDCANTCHYQTPGLPTRPPPAAFHFAFPYRVRYLTPPWRSSLAHSCYTPGAATTADFCLPHRDGT